MKVDSVFFRSVVVVFISLLSGCVSGYPKDLEFEKLSLVKLSSETEKEIDYGRYLSGDGKFFRLTLEVSTTADLIELAGKYFMRVDTYFCDRPSYPVLIDIPGLYWSGKDVNGQGLLIKYGSSEVPEEAITEEPDYLSVLSVDKLRSKSGSGRKSGAEEDGRNLYTMFLSIYSPGVKGSTVGEDGKYQNEYEAYDLVEHPEDICVAVEGRTMVGGIRSNVVKVDKGLVSEVLKDIASHTATH